MKRSMCLVLTLLLALSILGCNGTDLPVMTQPSTVAQVETTTQPIASELPAPYQSNFPKDLEKYIAPWYYNVSAEAVGDGKIHYYFMASKGLLIHAGEDDPYKWGDSTLIVFPNGQTMLIDTGMTAYLPFLVENLRRMGVTKLDYLMISHPHGDHCWGVNTNEGILQQINVGAVLYNGVDRGNVSDMIYRRCAAYNVPIIVVEQGDIMQFGPVRMEVLWPLPGTEGQALSQTEEVNNSSLVVRFDYKDHSSLFTGDLYASGETQLMDSCPDKLEADLLKVPHHGYNTSSSTLFVFSVKPQIAVAMGAYRSAIHQRYEAMGATFLYDRYHGYIHVSSDGTDMTYETDLQEQ